MTDLYNILITDTSFQEFVKAIFYVGKGTGKRTEDHFKDARMYVVGQPMDVEVCYFLYFINSIRNPTRASEASPIICV